MRNTKIKNLEEREKDMRSEETTQETHNMKTCRGNERHS